MMLLLALLAATSMPDAVAAALAHNPGLTAVDRDVDAAAAREVQAAAWPNPNVSLMVDQVPVNNPAAGTYMVGLGQPLLGGQRDARLALARLERAIAGLDREVARRDLTAEVQQAYVQLLFEEQGLKLADLGADASRSVLAATRARYQAGELAQVEVLRAEVEHSRSLREGVSARNRVAQARGKLNVLLGRPAQAAFAAADPGAPSLDALPPLAALLERAAASRVELRRAALLIEREALQRQLARTGLWTGTEVSLAGGSIAGQPGFSTTLTLPVPLYRQEGEVAEAEANRLRAGARRTELANGIGLEVGQAYRDAQDALQQARLFERSYLPQAEQLAQNARRRFVEGEGSGLEVLEARRALTETRTEQLRAVLAFRLAMAHLERAVGAAVVGGR